MLVGHAQRRLPAARLPADHRRRIPRPGSQPALLGHAPGVVDVLLDVAALVGRRRGTKTPQRQARMVLQRHQLEGEHLANQRLGGQAELPVDAAKPVLREEDAAAVLPFGQEVLRFPQAAADDDFLAAKVGVLLPALLPQSLQVAVVKPNDRSPAAAAAAVAVPRFDNRQGANGQGHASCTVSQSQAAVNQNVLVILRACDFFRYSPGHN